MLFYYAICCSILLTVWVLKVLQKPETFYFGQLSFMIGHRCTIFQYPFDLYDYRQVYTVEQTIAIS